MVKIENPLLLSLYSQTVDRVLSETANIQEANQRLRDLGHEMASQIYLTTDIVDKLKEKLTTREDVARLIDLLFRILYDKKPTTVDMESARGCVRVTDASCMWCQDVHLEGMLGFGYCEVFSGILESVLGFKGVEAKAFQESCRATGADSCTWNVRLV
jgi:hypothetical protein